MAPSSLFEPASEFVVQGPVVFFENEIQVSDFFERDLKGLGTLEKVYNLDERKGTFDQVGIELGLYFVALTFCMLKLMDEVRGKP